MRVRGGLDSGFWREFTSFITRRCRAWSGPRLRRFVTTKPPWCSRDSLGPRGPGDESKTTQNSGSRYNYGLRIEGVAPLFLPSSLPAGRKNCGCSSVVEHLLAKEDVASSSLVTRSLPKKMWRSSASAKDYGATGRPPLQ